MYYLSYPGARAVFAETVERLQEVLGEIGSIEIAEGKLDDWYRVGRTCQVHEIWSQHGEWIVRDNPEFGPGVRERLEWGRQLTGEEVRDATIKRVSIRTQIHEVIRRHGILVLPTSPGIAPLKSLPMEKIEKFRDRALKTLCLSGLSAVPQISMPIAEFEDAPFGISLMGSPGTDEALMDLAEKIESALGMV